MPKRKKKTTPIVERRRAGGFAATEAAALVVPPKSDKASRQRAGDKRQGLTHRPFEGLLTTPATEGETP